MAELLQRREQADLLRLYGTRRIDRDPRLHSRRVQSDGLNLGEVDWLAAEREAELPGEYQHLGQLLRKVLPELGNFYEGVTKKFEDCTWVGYRLAEILPLSLSDKQYCLELDDPLARLARLSPLIQRAE